MPLIPEKLNSRQEVRNAIASQFWDQPVQSGRSIDGTARLHACEPPPAGQTAAGGLMRSQELLITQAAGLPVMPGFSEDNGGVVSWQSFHTQQDCTDVAQNMSFISPVHLDHVLAY